jgi:alpha-glucosidase
MAGFTEAADAWLPLGADHAVLAVDAQECDPESVLAFTRRFLAFRRSSPALRNGDFIALDAPEPVLVFERRMNGERLLCLFNLGADPVRRPLAAASLRMAVGEAQLHTGAVSLGGYSALFAAI